MRARAIRSVIPIILLNVGMGMACQLSATPAPTATAIKETVEVPVTREVIITATPELTSEALAEGPLIFSDTFEDGAGEWVVRENPDWSIKVEDGTLIMNVLKPNALIVAAHPELNFLSQPTALELDMAYVSGDEAVGAGVQFRYQDEKNYAMFSINANKFVNFGVLRDGDYSEIVPWTKINGINRGKNHVALFDTGSRVAVYVDEVLILSLPFERLKFGSIDLQVNTYTGAATWKFDNVVLHALHL